MFIKLNRKRGQNTAEYAIIIGLVIGAAIAMQAYFKRGWQSSVKFAVDKLQKTGGTGQYEPYYLESDYSTTAQGYEATEETKAEGEVVRTIGSDAAKQTTIRTGYQKIKDATNPD